MSAMQNKPKSNFYSSRDFTATTIDAFKLTGKSLRLIDFNSISFLRGNWNWNLRIQQSFKSTLQMQVAFSFLFIIAIGSELTPQMWRTMYIQPCSTNMIYSFGLVGLPMAQYGHFWQRRCHRMAKNGHKIWQMRSLKVEHLLTWSTDQM